MPLPHILFRALACFAILASTGVAGGEEPVVDGGITFEERTFHELPFTVARIKLEEESLQLFWKRADGKPHQNFHGLRDDLKSQGQELVLATNAGIYAEDRTPLGLHVEKSVELRALNLHKGSQSNFALKPNGVFFLDNDGAHVLTTEDYAAKQPAPILATQSGPLLVIDGALHPKFKAESLSLNLRNGIGVISPTEVVIVISNWPVNLHTFASFFTEVLHCDNALYLDGSLSGLSAPAIDRKGAGLEYVG
ncbi:MAG: phosphodiester glycosidase family protein, partial [Verrucomicrobiales bacterium]